MKKRILKIGLILTALAMLSVTYLPVIVSASKSFLSISVSQGTQAGTTDETPKAPSVYGKVYVKLEESGCKIQEGNIRLRFDYYLDPSASGYGIHHVYVLDETSAEYLKGYTGKLDKDGLPLKQTDYDNWLNSLPRIWRDNPFICVFIYVPPTITDEEIKIKASNIRDEAYQYWIIGNDMRNFRTTESAMTVKELSETEKAAYDTKLASIKASKEVFSLAP